MLDILAPGHTRHVQIAAATLRDAHSAAAYLRGAIDWARKRSGSPVHVIGSVLTGAEPGRGGGAVLRQFRGWLNARGDDTLLGDLLVIETIIRKDAPVAPGPGATHQERLLLQILHDRSGPWVALERPYALAMEREGDVLVGSDPISSTVATLSLSYGPELD